MLFLILNQISHYLFRRYIFKSNCREAGELSAIEIQMNLPKESRGCVCLCGYWKLIIYIWKRIFQIRSNPSLLPLKLLPPPTLKHGIFYIYSLVHVSLCMWSWSVPDSMLYNFIQNYMHKTPPFKCTEEDVPDVLWPHMNYEAIHMSGLYVPYVNIENLELGHNLLSKGGVLLFSVLILILLIYIPPSPKLNIACKVWVVVFFPPSEDLPRLTCAFFFTRGTVNSIQMKH